MIFFIQYGIPLKSMIEKNGWALSWANHQNEDQKMKLRPSCMTRLGCLTVFRHISKTKILWISTTGQLPVKATGQSQLRQSLGDPDTYEPGYVDRGFGCEPEGDNFVPPPLFGYEEDDSASDDEDAGASEDEDTQAPGGEDDSGNVFAGEDESGSDEEDSSSGSEDESGGDKEGSTFG
jgi:hypothetical protein